MRKESLPVKMHRIYEALKSKEGTVLVVVPDLPVLGFTMYGACKFYGLQANLIDIKSLQVRPLADQLSEEPISIMTGFLAQGGFKCSKDHTILIADKKSRFSKPQIEQILGRSPTAASKTFFCLED